MHRLQGHNLTHWLLLACLVVLPCSMASASDPEGCLNCHRYRGLCRLDEDGKVIRLYYVNQAYYDHAQGPHARLLCTNCHNREEVSVIPHDKTTPVDCTSTCHLASQTRLDITFAHDMIADMLETSAHTQAVLEKANELLGTPLQDGQSRCLLCHDEPVFRRLPGQGGYTEAPIGRCNVCHDEQLPVDTRYYYQHVHARSRSARNNRDIVRLCTTCHSDPKIREYFELPDSTVSYLASFHGKATLLGSEETAECLDCHVGPMRNVHIMKAHDDADSSVAPDNVADTCRSPSCHPTAGHRVSDAAVHLDVTASRGLEYLIACVFIGMIILTFGPSALLTCMELFQVVIGREDPKHEERRKLAERLLSDPRGRKLLTRFTPHQRIQHWGLFLCFTTLVVTGFPMKFAEQAWAGWIIEFIGSLGRARLIHRLAGILMLAGFIYHMCYLFYKLWRAKQRTQQGFIPTLLDSPIVMRPSDWKHMLELLAYLLCLRRTRPEAAHFSTEEKFEYFGVFWGVIVLGLTGLILWGNVWVSRYFSGRVLTVASVVHTFEAFLALLHVGIVHMVSVIFSPRVSPVSMAMFTGVTPPDALAEGHAGMLRDVAEEIGLENDAEANDV